MTTNTTPAALKLDHREALIARGYKVGPNVTKPGKFGWSQNNGTGQVKSYASCSDFDTEEQAWASAQQDLEESFVGDDQGMLYQVRASLMMTEARARELDASLRILHDLILSTVKKVIKPGFILEPRQLGRIEVVAGNSRGAMRYEVANEPLKVKFKPNQPELAQFVVNAWPLNADGKRMSGRAGNSRVSDDTVLLSVEVCRFNLDDPLPGSDILVRGVQNLLYMAKQEALKAGEEKVA